MNLVKSQGKKINTQKYLAFLHMNNDKSEREIKESITFTIGKKKKRERERIKHLRINLPKETKYLYTKNYKTLMKEIKDNTNRWGDILCSWIRRLNIVKMTKLSKAIYRFNAIPIKITWHFSENWNRKFHNLYGNTKDPK